MRKGLGFLFLLLASTSWGQPTISEEAEMAIRNGLNFDFESYFDLLEFHAQEKIAVNFSGAEDLLSRGIFDIYQVNNLLQYRERSGKIYSHFELAQIKGFEPSFIDSIKHLLDFKSKNRGLKLYAPGLGDFNHYELAWRWSTDLTQRKGFKEQHYYGNPWDSRLRFRYRNGRQFSLGFNLQKDPGEDWQSPNQVLAHDHAAYFMAIRNWHWVETALIGDYRSSFGHGLSLGSSIYQAGGLLNGNLSTPRAGIRAYAGSEENRFFRGSAVSLAKGPIKAQFFYSSKKVDGSPEPGLLARSFSGLHRTSTELSKKNQVHESFIGSMASWQNQQWHCAAMSWFNELSKSQSPKTRWINHSFSFNYFRKGFNSFGELALNTDGKHALLIGSQFQAEAGFKSALIFLQKADGFYSPFLSNPLLRRDSTEENGLMLQIQKDWSYSSSTMANIYTAKFIDRSGPAQKVQARIMHAVKSNGRQFRGQLIYSINWAWKHLEEQKELSAITEERAQLRLNWQSPISEHLVLKLCLAHNLYRQDIEESSYGYLIALDLKFMQSPLSLKSGIRFCGAPKWNNRFYQYEEDLRFEFSIPALYGNSNRFYLASSWNIIPQICLESRLALSYFHDRESISSGWQKIDGPLQAQFKIQMLIKY